MDTCAKYLKLFNIINLSFPVSDVTLGFKNFFIRSAGSKVIATIRYIFITTKYVLASHYNFWPEPPTGIKLVRSRLGVLGDKRMTKLGLLADW